MHVAVASRSYDIRIGAPSAGRLLTNPGYVERVTVRFVDWLVQDSWTGTTARPHYGKAVNVDVGQPLIALVLRAGMAKRGNRDILLPTPFGS
jgi:hypothetical protein